MQRAAVVLCVTLFASLVSSVASAGLFRAYLSVNGNDGNPCTVQQPCRLLPAALAAVNDGGEVWMLDSANYNTDSVNITKSVTILAVPGALGSFVAPLDGVALSVNADADVGFVTLRNINVRDLNGRGNTTTGIHVVTGKHVQIENCEIYGVNNGIQPEAVNSSSTTIVNTTIHDTFNAVDATGGNSVTVQGSNVSNNGYGLYADASARVTISNSTFTDNAYAIGAFALVGAFTVVDVSRSTISSTRNVGMRIGATPGNRAEIFVHSTAMHVDKGFVFAQQGGTEAIFTYSDNQLVYYTTATDGGSLTPISAI